MGIFGAAPYEDKSDILAMAQALHKVDENFHALGDAHVSGVDKDLASGQRGFLNRDAASDVRRRSEPVMQNLDAPARVSYPFWEIIEVGFRLHADCIRDCIVRDRDHSKGEIHRPLLQDAEVDRPFRKDVPQDHVIARTPFRQATERRDQRPVENRRRKPDDKVPLRRCKGALSEIPQQNERQSHFRDRTPGI